MNAGDIAKRIKELSESQTLEMAAKSRELKKQGKDIINLSLGEPDFDTPDYINEAAKRAIDEKITHYPPVNGIEELREAVCKKLERDNGLHYNPDNIVISTGAKQTLMNVFLSLVNPRDEVLLPTPYWVSYYAMCEFTNAKIKTLKTDVDSGFKMTPEKLRKKLSGKTKLLVFSSPCNPSGSAYNSEELSALAAVIEEYPNLYVVSDEIYELITFDGHKHASLASFENIKDRVITVNGVSKGFAMTGWRIGYLAAHETIAKACTKIQGQFTSGANTIAQTASIAALENSPEKVNYMIEAFARRRQLILDKLDEIDGMAASAPEGAFYVFPDVKTYFGRDTPNGKVIAHSTDLCMYLLEEAEVSTVPGEAFGDENCIRISYATDEQSITRAMDRIKAALDKLK